MSKANNYEITEKGHQYLREHSPQPKYVFDPVLHGQLWTIVKRLSKGYSEEEVVQQLTELIRIREALPNTTSPDSAAGTVAKPNPKTADREGDQ